MVFAYLTSFLIWRRLTRSLGLKAPVAREGRAWFLSQLGKYVPGKITLLLVRVDAYHGYSGRKVAVATAVEYFASLTAACLLVPFALVSLSGSDVSHIVWAAVACIALFLLILWPPLLKRLFNWAFRLLKRGPLEEMPSYGLILSLIMAYIFPTLLHGFGLFFVLNSFSPVSFSHYLTVTGIYVAAGLVGIAAIFAPGGIGVREGILFLMLPTIIPKPAVIVGGIVTRLVLAFVELVLAGVFIGAQKCSRRQNDS